jgi:hypothetical protein
VQLVPSGFDSNDNDRASSSQTTCWTGAQSDAQYTTWGCHAPARIPAYPVVDHHRASSEPLPRFGPVSQVGRKRTTATKRKPRPRARECDDRSYSNLKPGECAVSPRNGELSTASPLMDAVQSSPINPDPGQSTAGVLHDASARHRETRGATHDGTKPRKAGNYLASGGARALLSHVTSYSFRGRALRRGGRKRRKERIFRRWRGPQLLADSPRIIKKQVTAKARHTTCKYMHIHSICVYIYRKHTVLLIITAALYSIPPLLFAP